VHATHCCRTARWRSAVSEAGERLWQASRADIFSEGFALHADHVEALDFDRRAHRFGYDRGELLR